MDHPVANSSFERLLAPVTEAEFLHTFWEQKHLHLVRNTPEFYQDILKLDELDEYLSRNDIRYPSLRMIRAGKGIAVSDYTKTLKFGNYVSEGLVDIDRVYDLYNQGASIVLQLMKSSLNGLVLFTNKLQQRLRFNVEATVYLTPSSEQGFTTHYDTHSVIILQISGKKRWRLYDYPKRFPLLHETFDTISYTPPKPACDITLSPGDFLYVPRGLAHDATSTEGGKSVHITLGLFPVMWRDMLEEHISSLKTDIKYRRAPISYFYQNTDRNFINEFRTLAVQAFNDADVSHLKRLALEKHLPRQNRITAKRLQDCEELASLNSNSQIRVRDGIVFSCNFDQKSISVSFYDKKISLPIAVRPAIERILSGKICAVHQIQSNLDEKGQITLVRKLILEGLLEFTS